MAEIEIENVDDLEFKWGRKIGAGWENQEVQHYESFTYDGIEYTLYDCVYMHNDGEPEPYIGKLIGIWETEGKRKKVNVHWFFRPIEILNWVGDQLPKENEIFLATGEGIGLANVNPLEAIAGKCDVVCISEDSRNWQVSEEEIKLADYIFYRTFDVGLHNISDNMGDKIGGLEVKYVFNTKKNNNVINLQSPPSMAMGVDNDVARNGQNKLLKPNSHHKSVAIKDVKGVLINSECIHEAKPDHTSGIKSPLLTTTNEQPHIATSGQKVEICGVDFAKNEANKATNNKIKAKERPCSDALYDRTTKKPRVDNPTKSFVDNTSSSAKNLITQGDNRAMVTLVSQEKTKYGGKNPFKLDKRVTFAKDAKDPRGCEDGPSSQIKKVVGVNGGYAKDSRGPKDGPSKQSKKVVGSGACTKDPRGCEDGPSNQIKKVVGVNGAYAKDSRGPKDGPKQSKKVVVSGACTKDSRGPEDRSSTQSKKVVGFNGACAKNPRGLEDGPSNQSKKVVGFNGACAKDSRCPEDRPSSQLKKVANFNGVCAKESRGPKDGPSNQSKKVASFDGACAKDLTTTTFVGRTYGPKKDFVGLNSSKENALADTRKFSGSKLSKVSMELFNNGGETQCKVTHNQDIDKSGWWSRDVKLRNAKGIVLLLNLDPEYTSRDVEEIIRDAFQIGCTAMMLQRTRISSPNSGQALVRFEGRETTEMVINKLHEGCLMLPNGRPLVGCAAPPLNSKGKQDTHFGHLVIDNIKLQGNTKDAVSTSHCSQPNSIEYEMAMEWCLLEAKFDQCWENLYKLHAKDIRLLETSLKSK